MGRAACGDLGTVRHNQHLNPLGDTSETFAYCGGGRTADAGIHLIEHQGRDGGAGGQHHLHRQHQP